MISFVVLWRDGMLGDLMGFCKGMWVFNKGYVSALCGSAI